MSKRLDREERRVLLLSAAREVFVEKGYKGSTTLEIAKRAEVSEVTLFRYFESKQELFMACILPVLTETLEHSLLNKNEDPMQRLEDLLKDRLKLVSENREVVKLILMENQVNEDFKKMDFVDMIGRTVREVLEEIYDQKTQQSFMHRLIMGSLLSFLYLPEQKPGVEAFLAQLMSVAEDMERGERQR